MIDIDLSNIKNKNILITGGAGFIGSNLVKFFAERKIRISVIDNLSTGNIKNIEPYMDYVYFSKTDIRDLKKLEKTFGGLVPDLVFHMAALPGVPGSVADPCMSNSVNLSGFLNILKISNDYNVNRVIFSSSSSVYGGAEDLPTPETYCGVPKSPYALQKLTCEKYCQLFSSIYNIDTVSLRYFNVFGPNQGYNSKYSAVISSFCNSVKKSTHPVIYGDGEQLRDFCYVDNVVYANVLAALYDKKLNGSAFNVGTGFSRSVNSLCSELNTLEPKYDQKRSGDVLCSQADISKISSLLGYKVIVDFEVGIKKTLKYYLES